MDLARLTVSFDTVAALLECIADLLRADSDGKLRVCWLDNKFRAPSALGYRDVNVGVAVEGADVV